MTYYEICVMRDLWVVWKVTGYTHYERVKSFKTRKGAENWAAKQWAEVVWQ